MDIRAVDGRTIEITGNIKSLDDYDEIKNVSQSLVAKGADHITFNVLDSLSMVSSVIGYLIKLINVDNITIQVNVWDDRLYNLLDQLNLIELFNVHRK
ncbi:conserved hypothetical protein [Denitrovibrio acetiphilus DSM 12809]|jgi:hypothetical protein|uniref:STAS domain-containing protein n=1 Tax=Denitrovibrio acetiphilus (strain DSM 12809 / NBRC 114555 / N2460) TaxID=522772 RepID=D4H8W6_DENA2|nr:hypothetical protein [Denitrovibrio acetiphilus]ADD68465.1 conserved hypothetical protein [Denitrovibrio acetiphilus DSM 12809]